MIEHLTQETDPLADRSAPGREASAGSAGEPLTRIRPFSNGDPPALARLWNTGLPLRGAARPLGPHEFDALVPGKLHFEHTGLLVAEHEGKIVGFVHAGFGAEQPEGPSHALCREMGTVGLLVMDPTHDDPALEQRLIVAAERYLRERGASIVYAGGQYPVNPFYWGIYGGSEWAGILSSHTSFHRAVLRAGYEPVSTSVLLEVDLETCDARDPLAAILRRRARVETTEDVMLRGWWDAVAIGPFRPTEFRLVSRSDERELARAVTWDMGALGFGNGRGCIGLVALDVHPSFRRQGLGRHLVAEILRQTREQLTGVVAVQTSSTNLPALGLYRALGFITIETSTLYRLPVRQGARAIGEVGSMP